MGRKSLLTSIILFMMILSFEMPVFALDSAQKSEGNYPTNTSHQNIIFYDSFEFYDNWLINFPPWSCLDNDSDPTIGHSYYSWPHENEAYAFIIFNSSDTTPSMSEDPDAQPHSGTKYAAGFNDINLEYTSDDWLITPKLSANSYGQINFWAKSYSSRICLAPGKTQFASEQIF